MSGGRYDRLLKRLGKKAGAIGFAVYLDRLERFENEAVLFDVDVVLQYDETTNIRDLFDTQARLIAEGKLVMATRELDPTLRYRQRIKLTNGGMEILETNG